MMVVAADQAVADSKRAEKWSEREGRVGVTQPQLLVCREGSCLLPAYTVEEAEKRIRNIKK